MLKEDIAAKSAYTLQFISEIEIEVMLDPLSLLLIDDLIEHLAVRFRSDYRKRSRLQIAAHSQHRRTAYNHMQIGGSLPNRLFEIMVNYSHSSLPLTLSLATTDRRFKSFLVEGKLHAFLRADLSALHQLDQRIVHPLHSEVSAGLDHARYLKCLLVSNKIGDGWSAEQDLCC